MDSSSRGTDALASRTLHGTVSLLAWTVAWVASVALAAFGPRMGWIDTPVVSAIAIAGSVIVGAGMLLAHRQHLRSIDEMQRAIQLEAMGWTLGVGLVGGVAWSLVTRHGLVPAEAEIAHLMVLMAAVYIVGSIAGVLRYR